MACVPFDILGEQCLVFLQLPAFLSELVGKGEGATLAGPIRRQAPLGAFKLLTISPLFVFETVERVFQPGYGP